MVQIYDESYTGATVYPVVYNFTADPTSEGSALILTNKEDLSPDRKWVQWSTEVVEAANTEGDDAVTVDEESDEESAEDLTGYGQEEVALPLPIQGTLYDFPYKIVVPEDAEPGTHLISLVFQLKAAEQTNQDGAAVYIGSNVATNIFLKVLGTTIDDISVDFQTGIFGNKDQEATINEKKDSFESKSFFLKPPVDFLVTVANNGNTHQKPDGNIKIVNDLFGSRTEEIQVNELNRIILPGTDRTFEVDNYGQGFMIGKYRAKITLLYGDPLRPVQKEISFWIVPLVEILIALGIILLIIIIIIIWKKSRKKKEKKREIEREEKMRQQIIEEMKKQQPQAVPVTPEVELDPESSSGEKPKAKPKVKAKTKKKGGNGKSKAGAYKKK